LASDSGRLFVEAGGFGSPASILSIDRDRVTLYMPNEATAYQGNGEESLAELFGARMASNEWVNVLLGKVPEHPGGVTQARLKGGQWDIRTGKGAEEAHLSIIAENAWLNRFERPAQAWILTYGKPKTSTAGFYPSRIRLSSGSSSLDLTFEKVEPNSSLADKLFDVDLPPGTMVREMKDATALFGSRSK
jgi:hypothetical protein